MIKVSPDIMNNIAPLFSDWEETLIWSCLQGHMGEAWADDTDNPAAAQIITGDFCFFAGDSHCAGARSLVLNIPCDYSRAYIIMVPQNEAWAALIEEAYPGKHEKFTRYAIKKESDVFDRQKLETFARQLPKGYILAPIDERLYNISQNEKWAADFCAQFADFDDYKKRGIGFAILYGNKFVCGASSYTVYDFGIEIEIGTEKAHRRKGLATACAAGLILECLNRGLYPSWDAANKESAALAEKLGYHFDREYSAYEITTGKNL